MICASEWIRSAILYATCTCGSFPCMSVTRGPIANSVNLNTPSACSILSWRCWTTIIRACPTRAGLDTRAPVWPLAKSTVSFVTACTVVSRCAVAWCEFTSRSFFEMRAHLTVSWKIWDQGPISCFRICISTTAHGPRGPFTYFTVLVSAFLSKIFALAFTFALCIATWWYSTSSMAFAWRTYFWFEFRTSVWNTKKTSN